MSQPMLTPEIELQLLLKHDLPTITANATQISRMIWNLLHNAIEACAHKNGLITLRTDLAQLDRHDLQAMEFGRDHPAGLYVLLEVSDTGAGMDALLQKRIFDPFFTTKTAGHGLGLSVVSESLCLYRGALKLDSRIGQGTRFRVYFPVA